MTFIQPAASHFINGRYVDDTNGPVLELIYPANGQPLGQLHAATPAIVEEALASAKQAQKSLGGHQWHPTRAYSAPGS